MKTTLWGIYGKSSISIQTDAKMIFNQIDNKELLPGAIIIDEKYTSTD